MTDEKSSRQASFPGEKKKKTRRKRTVPASLRRMYDKALVASKADVKAYQPTEADLQICDAYLQGCLTHIEISEHCGMKRETVSRHLQDPIVCAWVADNLHSVIKQRLGLLDAAMFSRGMAGNVAAAKLVMDRYNQLIDKKIVLHTTPDGLPFEDLSTEDLQKIVTARGKIVDVTQESPE